MKIIITDDQHIEYWKTRCLLLARYVAVKTHTFLIISHGDFLYIFLGDH